MFWWFYGWHPCIWCVNHIFLLQHLKYDYNLLSYRSTRKPTKLLLYCCFWLFVLSCSFVFVVFVFFVVLRVTCVYFINSGITIWKLYHYLVILPLTHFHLFVCVCVVYLLFMCVFTFYILFVFYDLCEFCLWFWLFMFVHVFLCVLVFLFSFLIICCVYLLCLLLCCFSMVAPCVNLFVVTLLGDSFLICWCGFDCCLFFFSYCLCWISVL
jgi:hypothetical protein